MPGFESTPPGRLVPRVGRCGATRRSRGLLDLFLLLEALAVGRRAQAVRTKPLPEAAAELAALRLPLRTADPARAGRAAARALSRGARRRGWLDSCLTRCLTAAALLDVRRRVTVHVGFRPGRCGPLEGHAWLGVDGENIELSAPPGGDAGPFEETLTLTIFPGETGT